MAKSDISSKGHACTAHVSCLMSIGSLYATMTQHARRGQVIELAL